MIALGCALTTEPPLLRLGVPVPFLLLARPCRASAVIDVLGADGLYRDPLWRVTVELSALEQELLRCWWVHRLQFVAHAGDAAISTTQSYSRLEHSLGLLALTGHFDPDDHTALAAALRHDVVTYHLSHTFEGVAGLNHHPLGAELRPGRKRAVRFTERWECWRSLSRCRRPGRPSLIWIPGW